MSLAMMVAWHAGNRWTPDTASQQLSLYNQRGSILPQVRFNLAKRAVEEGFTHVLFLDSDQVFPKDTLARLLCHNQWVVACNIATKKHPASPTARRSTGEGVGGELIVTTPTKTGLEQVWRVGTGVMLVDTRVFRRVKPPWFDLSWRRSDGEWHVKGEDWTFCEKVQAEGIPIFVDHALSLEIGHNGNYKYTHADVIPPEHVERAKRAIEGEFASAS